jgi:trans-aconitate methyltransferase
MAKIPLSEGRWLFGNDPLAYANARPDYPDELYEKLCARCGPRPGTAVFEIGAGTGLATRRLLALGASPLRAIEPDSRLANFLRDTISSSSLEIDQSAFEEAVLPEAKFSLGVAATSFHWLEQIPALAKAYRALQPGGWWAMWWNHFGSGEPDAFQTATDHLFVGTADSPSMAGKARLPFALDQESRIRDLVTCGFCQVEVDLWRWTLTYDTARLVALYSTFSPIQSLQPTPRRTFLTHLARIADEQFGGRVERPLISVLYTAQRPFAEG